MEHIKDKSAVKRVTAPLEALSIARRHRVDTELLARKLGLESLGKVDANYVKEKSGFSIGGASLMFFATYSED